MEVKEWKNTNINQWKTEVTISIPGKVNFRAKKITTDREGCDIMTKELIHKKTVLNM